MVRTWAFQARNGSSTLPPGVTREKHLPFVGVFLCDTRAQPDGMCVERRTAEPYADSNRHGEPVARPRVAAGDPRAEADSPGVTKKIARFLK